MQGAMGVPNAHEHVLCFFRNIANLDELIQDAQNNRLARDFTDIGPEGLPDNEAVTMQNSLKQRLSERLKGNVFSYPAKWIEGKGISDDHIQTLCNDVYRNLSNIISREISRIAAAGGIEGEAAEHEAFGAIKCEMFTGRDGILKKVQNYIRDKNPHPLIICGASGSGKSALMAYAAKSARGSSHDACIVSRFVGATPASSEGRMLIEGICRELSFFYLSDEEIFSKDYDDLLGEFNDLIDNTFRKEPLIIFIDALDQLPDGDVVKNLMWVPDKLSKATKLIISTTPGEEVSKLTKKLPSANVLYLDAMGPDEGRVLLERWLNAAGRTLTKPQKEQVLNKFSRNGLPLYLRLAFEEARRWKSYESSANCLLPEDIPGIITAMMGRLSLEANHGRVLVSRVLAYIAASRRGLSEDELMDLLSLDDEVVQDFRRRSPKSPLSPRLPVVVWSRLYFDLEPYLMTRISGGIPLFTFYHKHIERTAESLYLTSDTEKIIRLKIADYFCFRALDVRKSEELPWQLAVAGEWKRLKDCLSEPGMLLHLIGEDRKYELSGYWASIGSRYNPETAYDTMLERSKTLLLSDDEFVKCLNASANLLMLSGRYERSKALSRITAEVIGKGEDKAHPLERIGALNNMGQVLRSKGEYSEAESNFREALALAEKAYQSAGPVVAECLHNLSVALFEKGDYISAEPLIVKALEMRKQSLGEEHLDTALTMNNLATLIYTVKKDYAGAEDLFKRSLAIRQKLQGDDHPDLAILYNNIGELLSRRGDYKAAEPLILKARAIREKAFGPDHTETAMSYESIAWLHYSKREYDKSAQLLQRVLDIREKAFGPAHPVVVQTRKTLANVKRMGGQ